jgi:hypothetical protein
MGAHSYARRARGVTVARSVGSYADLHLEHEAPQARVYLEGVILGLMAADLDQPSTRDMRELSSHPYEALKRPL